MKQRAREFGALPSGLIRPGEIFDWPTLEPWADEVSAAEVKAADEASAARAKADAARPHESQSGLQVRPGKSEVTKPAGPSRRRGASHAES